MLFQSFSQLFDFTLFSTFRLLVFWLYVGVTVLLNIISWLSLNGVCLYWRFYFIVLSLVYFVQFASSGQYRILFFILFWVSSTYWCLTFYFFSFMTKRNKSLFLRLPLTGSNYSLLTIFLKRCKQLKKITLVSLVWCSCES